MFTIETATIDDFPEIMALDSSLAEFSHPANGSKPCKKRLQKISI